MATKQMMEDPSEEGGTLARATSFASGKELEKDALGKYQPTILLIFKGDLQDMTAAGANIAKSQFASCLCRIIKRCKILKGPRKGQLYNKAHPKSLRGNLAQLDYMLRHSWSEDTSFKDSPPELFFVGLNRHNWEVFRKSYGDQDGVERKVDNVNNVANSGKDELDNGDDHAPGVDGFGTIKAYSPKQLVAMIRLCVESWSDVEALVLCKKVDKNEQKALANELAKVASMAEEVLHTERLDCLETFCHAEITENYERGHSIAPMAQVMFVSCFE